MFLGAVLLTQLAIALHNDWTDRDLDARAKPWRLVPRGVLSARSVLAASLALLAAGLALAAPLGGAVLALVTIGTGMGFLYNAALKRTPLSWLPFCVALPSLVVCAGLAAGRDEPRLLAAYLIGAPLVVAIHLADTTPDIAADRAFGLRGLAHLLGERGARVACWLGAALGLVLAAAVPAPGWSPGPLFALSGALLVAAVALACWPRAHRYAVFTSGVALAAEWVRGFGA